MIKNQRFLSSRKSKIFPDLSRQFGFSEVCSERSCLEDIATRGLSSAVDWFLLFCCRYPWLLLYIEDIVVDFLASIAEKSNR